MVLALVWASTFAALAQSASDVARSYFDVFQTKNYQETATFFAPDELKDFREMLDFGDALPKEEAKQFYLTFFGEHASEETVSKMSDLDFFSQFLSFTTKQVEAAGEISFHKLEILGEIPEGDTIMHVLTRSNISVGDIEVESMEVISFRKIEGEWKALLSGK